MYVIRKFVFCVNEESISNINSATWYADGLALRVQKGDYSSFDELDKILRKKVTQITYKYDLAPFDREDLIQDLMIHAFMLCFTYEYDKGHYMNYCLYSLRRKAYSYIENFFERKKQEVMPENFYMVDKSNGLSKLLLKELGREYSTTLTVLSSLERLVLGMFIEMRSFDDIARISNLDEKAIINTMQRVRKKFSDLEDLHSIVDNDASNRYSILELK